MEPLLEEITDGLTRRRVFQASVDSDVINLIGKVKTHEVELLLAALAGLKNRG